MKRRLAGFTLIEVVVTAAIVGLLATIVLPLAEVSARRAKEAELRLALRQIREAIDTYKRAADRKQIEVSADASGYPRELRLLDEGVPDITRPQLAKIVFLRRLPRDPFHPDPLAPAADTWGKRAYASTHDAPFEGEDVFDVHSLAEGSGLNGVPYRQW